MKRPTKSATTSAPAGSVSLARRMAAWANWREQYNPLPGLTLLRARSLFEGWCRGNLADLQWTYAHPTLGIEATDADLFALLERCISPLLEMDYSIALADRKKKRGFDQVLAEEQQAALSEAYERIDNLYELIEHLAMARFRGYAHAEKCRDAQGELVHYELVDQWSVARCGLRGPWRYNPDARPVSGENLPEENTLDPQAFLIREARRHVNRIALTKFIRANLSSKDWDAFLEIYGVPGGVVIGPPNVPNGEAEAYRTSAEAIAKGGSGFLPNGSSYTANDSPRGVNPFRDHQRFLSEQLILAGTAGKLTMLAESGSGTLAGGAHADTFAQICRGEGRRISELLQRSVDAEVLGSQFPGRPQLAYFTLSFREETDLTALATQLASLKQAGLQADADEMSEKFGIKLTLAPVAAVPGLPLANRWSAVPRAVRNRAQSAAAVPSTPLPELLRAAAADLAPARARIEAILRLLEAGKDAAALSAVAQLQAEYPQLLGGDALASALEQSLGVATTAGAKSAAKDLSQK